MAQYKFLIHQWFNFWQTKTQIKSIQIYRSLVRKNTTPSTCNRIHSTISNLSIFVIELHAKTVQFISKIKSMEANNFE